MEYEELVEHYGAQPKENEEVTAILGFKQVELKKTLLSARQLLDEIEKLICAGKSFRAELVCGAEIEGNHVARAFLYTPTQSDEDCSTQEH